MTLKALRESAHAAAGAGAMAVCRHREGGDPPAGELVGEVPGSICAHPDRVSPAQTCNVMQCPVAKALGPLLVENIGSTAAGKLLAGVGGLSETLRNTVSGVAGKLLGRAPRSMNDAAQPGGVSLE